MKRSHSLESEYRTLLDRRGLGHLLAPKLKGWTNPFDSISADIHRTLEQGGIALPGPVYVGEYPHNSFNAQACAVTGGTLLLINTGLTRLLYEITKCLYSSVRTFTRIEEGGVQFQDATEETARRERNAAEALASSVVAYIFQGDLRLGSRQPMPAEPFAAQCFRLIMATERFVVGHEFGHLLAGHLHAPTARTRSSEWIRKSHDQEFEADEIGALLVQRGLEQYGNPKSRFLQRISAAAGPFLFFTIDHLITRIRTEVSEIPGRLIVTDHPPSDERAAALRKLFLSLDGPSVLQLADICVDWLSSKEDEIIDTARRLVGTPT